MYLFIYHEFLHIHLLRAFIRWTCWTVVSSIVNATVVVVMIAARITVRWLQEVLSRWKWTVRRTRPRSAFPVPEYATAWSVSMTAPSPSTRKAPARANSPSKFAVLKVCFWVCFSLSHIAVHYLHHLHYQHLYPLLLVHYFMLNLRLGFSANPFPHRPFPFLPDWFHGLSDHYFNVIILLNGWIRLYGVLD